MNSNGQSDQGGGYSSAWDLFDKTTDWLLAPLQSDYFNLEYVIVAFVFIVMFSYIWSKFIRQFLEAV
jgi:hypothetical protein